MDAPVLYVFRGLPGSGKSTQARELSQRLGIEVVNRDALRMALLGSYWTGDPDDEAKLVQLLRRWTAADARRKVTVIFDGGRKVPMADVSAIRG